MKKNYIMPQTEAQIICVSQLMAGSSNRMGINDDPLNGGGASEIIYGG